MIDLPQDQLARVRGILATHVGGMEVRAFGSRVAGNARQWSDLDLAIVTPEPVGRMTLATLRDDLTESDLPIAVDIVEWRDLPPGILQNIGADWEVIQPADPPDTATNV
ncbi:MAG: nucleotidyltransferase domain-containing protein [Armatimonadetes bacterium]|nr:nucleotidyltransferase domain-containing protein [Armatimonadota bacterium]